MKIRRFFAPDMRSAINKVREEIGEDAVILSNRRVDNGVEIVAAVDYDESAISDSASERSSTIVGRESDFRPGFSSEYPQEQPAPLNKRGLVHDVDAIFDVKKDISDIKDILRMQHANLSWSNAERTTPEKTRLLLEMTSFGMSPRLIRDIVAQVPQSDSYESCVKYAFGVLSKMLVPHEGEIMNDGGVYAIVGPSGSGKTTTIAKLAARFAIRNGSASVAIVSMDDIRIGAYDQMLTYSRILSIPLHAVQTREELMAILRALSGFKLVLIDTPGIGIKDFADQSGFESLRHNLDGISCLLTLPANLQSSIMGRAIELFSGVGANACILTKTDDTMSAGEVVSELAINKMPVAFITDGQMIPENIDTVTPRQMLMWMIKLRKEFGGQADEEITSQIFGGLIGNGYV